MPEPDLPPLILSQSHVDSLCAALPELPDDRRERVMRQYALGAHDASVLLGEAGGVEYFEEVGGDVGVLWRGGGGCEMGRMTHELFGQLATRAIPFQRCPVPPRQLGSLVDAVKGGMISGKIGKDVLAVMIDGDVRPAAEIVEEKGWHVVGDAAELRKVCEDLVANNKDKASRCTFFTSAGLVHPCARCRHDPQRKHQAVHVVRRTGDARDKGEGRPCGAEWAIGGGAWGREGWEEVVVRG
ncbi:hypothetical protein BC936DRAFT_145129 [Jimgerdemannia flammicorona]|uniref:Asn/Gln amidotransferase domain-containing protein n=1 Tax=Jimgerdemannia flammicorona TaxID=994334 RepID=A0A433DAU9_9FUNG|nr:hypothetical protein BC936DRAFT_145129 [Jimgerdemannia flammicorona]